MFTITCNWTLLSLHIFVEVELDLILFSFFTSFEIYFDTPPSLVPINMNAYPQNNQGEWSKINWFNQCIFVKPPV